MNEMISCCVCPIHHSKLMMNKQISKFPVILCKTNSFSFQRLLYLKKLDGYPVIRNVEVAEEEETDEVLQMDEIDRMANEGDEEEVEDAEKGEEEEDEDEDDEEEGEDDDVDSQNSSVHED